MGNELCCTTGRNISDMQEEQPAISLTKNAKPVVHVGDTSPRKPLFHKQTKPNVFSNLRDSDWDE
jgi:hypothetical protein